LAGKRKTPQARDRTIGAQLRAVRLEQTTLSLEAAAEVVGWSAATLSRTENGKRHISSEDVSAILAVYGVPVSGRGTGGLVVASATRSAPRRGNPRQLRVHGHGAD
jgi:transcriptional regulator with XRE-family HTH domain